MRFSERRNVDFPHPVGPMRAVIVRGANPRLMSLRTFLAPKPTPTSRAARVGASSTPTAARLGAHCSELSDWRSASADGLGPASGPWSPPTESDVVVIKAEGTDGR